MKRILLICLSIFLFLNGFSQYDPFNPYSSFKYPTVNMPMKYEPSNKLEHYKYEYTVLMNNGTIRQVKGKITYDNRKKKYYLKSRKTKIYCSDTKAIYRISEDKDTILGNFVKDKWLFPVIKGNINCYSIYASNQKNYITHIQKGDSKLFDYDKKFLKNEFPGFIRDDFKSYNLYLKDKKRRKIRLITPPIIFISCVALAAIAPYESPLMFASWLGAPILSLSPLLIIKRISPIKVIESYNENKNFKK